MQDPRIAFLRDVGLTDSQARVYVALAQLGRASAREASERAGTPRTQVYAILDTLAASNLVARDGDAYVARPLARFLQAKAEESETRRDRLLAARDGLARHFAPSMTTITGRDVRLLRGPARPAELLAEWLEGARERVVAAFTPGTLTDALRTPDVGRALTGAVARVPDARLVLHAPAAAPRLAALPHALLPLTRLAPPEAWHFDRVLVDDARLLMRFSLATPGTGTADAPPATLAVATAHPGLVADARAVLRHEWAHAEPAQAALAERFADGRADRDGARAEGTP